MKVITGYYLTSDKYTCSNGEFENWFQKIDKEEFDLLVSNGFSYIESSECLLSEEDVMNGSEIISISHVYRINIDSVSHREIKENYNMLEHINALAELKAQLEAM